MQKLFAIFAIILYLSCGVTARERTDSLTTGEDDGGPLVVSLVTCAPGPDVYELCGHAALRIRNEKMDSVWNYGIFDFDTPNFIYRFCKGQTDYMVCGYQFGRFMPIYVRRGSRVTEQVLDLTQQEAHNLRKLLQIETLPQNRTYRYNYVKDNCATRPWERIKEAIALGNDVDSTKVIPAGNSGGAIIMPDTLYYKTFRQEMRHFHRNYPWYQFGIDLALGRGIDRSLQKDEDIFAPPVLAAKAAQATVGGKPLVKETKVIFQGYVDATLPPTPWCLTPSFLGLIMLIISLAVCMISAYGWGTGRIKFLSKVWISAYFIIAGLAGFVIAFLVFFSEHEATSPNGVLLWLNPLQLIIGAGIWFKSWRKIVYPLAMYDFFLGIYIVSVRITSLFIPSVYYFHFASQISNTAIFLMSVCLIPLGAAVLYMLKSQKKINA